MHHAILDVRPLGSPWETPDPFLLCVHHLDAYPPGNEQMGPAASLAGRNLGQDLALKDGWRMYHGKVVPGFPQHPHRGFETVTIVRRGTIDHSDSLGAAARFGDGDVQWLTAGQGIVHAEMFPLLEREKPNTVELFQIWLNLPGEDKLTSPHFSMLWSRDVPRGVFVDTQGHKTDVTIVAGQLDGRRAPSPPPRSWASRPDTDVAIWCIRMDPHATWTLPRALNAAAVRQVYFYRGKSLRIESDGFDTSAAIRVDSARDLTLVAGETECELLLLQGRPIAEPVAQHGPFVMNTRAEVERAFSDYQRTRFGGWPWPTDDPVHGRERRRFAKHIDGHVERLDE